MTPPTDTDTTVLIVDDDASIRRLIGRALAPLATRIVEASDVVEAQERVRRVSPDLIMLDVGLPSSSGHDLCKWLRLQDATAAVPIIMVTGRSGHDEHLRALEFGATDFISKPFRAQELAVRARNLLSLHLTQRRLRELQLQAAENHAKEQRSRFERYLAPSIVSRILDSGRAVEVHPLHDSFVCDAVVMFADLRGYTSLAERLSPSALVSMLNDFFEILVNVAHRHEGTTISMAGDCLMVAFGVPYEQADANSRALSFAVESRELFNAEMASWRMRCGANIGMGIGIAKGNVVAGNIGASEYMNFTVVGDVVNVAARLTARARAGEILLTPNLGQVARDFSNSLVLLPNVQLKGKAMCLDVWCLPAAKRWSE